MLPKTLLSLLRLVFMFIFIALSFFGLAQSEMEQSIDDQIESAKILGKQGEAERALDQLTALKVKCEKLHLDSQLAKTYQAMANVYYHAGDITSSVKYATKALLMPNGLTDQDKVSALNLNGINYSLFGDYKNSLHAYNDAIRLARTIEKPYRFEHLYNNIAITYLDNNQIDSAKYFHNLCLRERKKYKDTMGLGQTYNNLGTLFYDLGNYDSSYYYFNLGYEYRKLVPTLPVQGLIESKVNLGKALIGLRQFTKAKQILEEQRLITIRDHHASLEQRCVKQLSILYEKTGDYKKAYFFQTEYYRLQDSLYSVENRDEIIRLNQMKIYSEKALKDSLENAETERLRLLEEKKEQEIQDQKDKNNLYIQIGLIVALLLISIIAYAVYRNFKNNKKFSAVILEQKEEVELQKNELTLVNQEITDSINYAKRIQSAILPSDQLLKKLFSNYFVYYQPKSIVAGDFYWAHEKENLRLFAAADCTGHGVPGAMVSVTCCAALNQAVEIDNLKLPGEILERTNKLVLDSFSNDDIEIQDGMDISLCAIDYANKKLYFSGANNPVYIIRNDELHEIKGTKKAIGSKQVSEAFQTTEFDLEVGDLIVSFTDGFADQFGGDLGKKYRYTQFKDFLVSIAKKDNLENELAREFNSWKRHEEQVDDICVFGVRIT